MYKNTHTIEMLSKRTILLKWPKSCYVCVCVQQKSSSSLAVKFWILVLISWTVIRTDTKIRMESLHSREKYDEITHIKLSKNVANFTLRNTQGPYKVSSKESIEKCTYHEYAGTDKSRPRVHFLLNTVSRTDSNWASWLFILMLYNCT